MKQIREKGKAIREYIIQNIGLDHIIKKASERFHITRQTVNHHIKGLIEDGIIESSGTTNNTKYTLKELFSTSIKIEMTQDIEEDRVWREKIFAIIPQLPENVRVICHYGFTEMFNNIIDHSGADQAILKVEYNIRDISIIVLDNGIGIFKKIKDDFQLEDERHSILELAKGKLTSDPKSHTGEGVFFTSRMFDKFSILSHNFFFSSYYGIDWLVESKKVTAVGTMVCMQINRNSKRIMQEIFSKFTSIDDFGFSKTIIPVELLQYEGEALISRSQAKRLIVRFEKFKEVILDFKGIKMIGQAFSDEIFRVFKNLYPSVHIIWINANKNVEAMINRVLSQEK